MLTPNSSCGVKIPIIEHTIYIDYLMRTKEELMNLYVKNLKKMYKFVIPLVFVESIANHPLYYILCPT
jgi:hypothetical protein